MLLGIPKNITNYICYDEEEEYCAVIHYKFNIDILPVHEILS